MKVIVRNKETALAVLTLLMWDIAVARFRAGDLDHDESSASEYVYKALTGGLALPRVVAHGGVL